MPGMPSMHIKKSPMGLAHRPNRHTPLHEQHKKQQQKHIEQEKNIYPYSLSIYTEKQKKKKCKTRVVSTHGARTVCKYVFV